MNSQRLNSQEFGSLLSAVNKIIFALKVENKEKLPWEEIRKAKVTLADFLKKALEGVKIWDSDTIPIDSETLTRSRIAIWFLELLVEDKLEDIDECTNRLKEILNQTENLESLKEPEMQESLLSFARKVRDRLLSDASQPMERVTIAEF